MRTAAFFLAFLIIAINSIAQDSTAMPYKKASDGSEYVIYSAANGAKIVTGNFMEMRVLAKYKDSVLFSTTEDAMPQYGLYDTANFPPPFKEAFADVKLGDSVLIRILTDSIIAKALGQAPAFMQKGEYIYQSYRITNIFISKEEVDSAQKTHIPLAKERAYKKQIAQIDQSLVDNKEQIAADSKIIETYLAKNNIKAIKANWGTYVVIKKAGTGKKITADGYAAVNYTGKTFGTNKVFDSNTDTKFKHVEPYEVNMFQMGTVILGWTDALLQMQQGTVATVYIPSSLAYGAEGRQPGIAPNSILVFDMAVVKVSSEEEMVKREADKTKQVVTAKRAIKKIPVQKKKPVIKPKTTTTKKAGK